MFGWDGALLALIKCSYSGNCFYNPRPREQNIVMVASHLWDLSKSERVAVNALVRNVLSFSVVIYTL